MTGKAVLALGVVALALSMMAGAELQNVEVGGQITILGEYYTNLEALGTGLRWPGGWLLGRPAGTGGPRNNGGIFSWAGWDDRGGDLAYVMQWTRLHFNADFTGEVSAFIEFDSVDVWGRDFRSDYITGADFRTRTDDDVEVYQAYIETDETFGYPLRLRIGRQEMIFGSEWLVGNNDNASAPVWGLSFDGIRLTYSADSFSLDAFWTKLEENFSDFGEEDVDFYGVYASCTAVENVVFDAYWLWMRDDRTIPEEYAGGLVWEWCEDLWGVDGYGATNLHTVGLRAAGTYRAFDFEAEAAYQFGDAGQIGALFVPMRYGDNDADFGEWALNLQVGYTLEMAWSPRVFLGYAYFGGEDNRDITFGQWLASLVSPLYTAGASVSFNRLFSDWVYSAILDGSEMSNAHFFRFGVDATPTDKVALAMDLGYYLAAEAFQRPVLPLLGFWSRKNDDELGWELQFSATYYYSDDLYFTAGWDHLFVGDGLAQGSFSGFNGLIFNGGSSDDDSDYLWFETGISF